MTSSLSSNLSSRSEPRWFGYQRTGQSGSGSRNAVLRWFLAILLSAPLLGSQTQSQRSPRAVVIEGATLIDGTGRDPLLNAVVVVVGNKIANVGARGTVQVPSGAEIVPAAGKFIIPGLIESHTHYPEWGGELFLAHGVTSVTDVGNSAEWIAAMKGVFRKGRVKMPRLFSTGNFLGAPASVSRGIRGEGSTITYILHASDAEEARRAARRILNLGMDGLKLWQNLSPEQIRALAEEARQANVPVMGHAYNGEEAAEQGYNRIEHTHGLHNAAINDPAKRLLFEQGKAFSPSLMQPEYFDPLIRLWVRKNVYYDPLLIFEYKAITKRSQEFEREVRALLENPNLRYVSADRRLAMVETYRAARETGLGTFEGPVDRLPPSKLPEYQEGYRKDQDFVLRFVKAGGKLCAGTDAAGAALVPGLSLHQELQMFVDAGLSPLQALLSATRNPAEFLRKLDQLGTVEAGKLADLVILTDDPLQNIANTKKISQVMLDGKFVDTAYHPDYRVPFDRPLPYGSVGIFPVPTLANLSPRWGLPGKEAPLGVEGRGFNYASEILFEDQPLPTKFLSPTELSATVPGTRVRKEGTYFIKVRNPRPGGGVSEPYGFVVFQKGD